MAETKDDLEHADRERRYREHCEAIRSRPPNISDAFFAINSLCCDVTDFSYRPELTETERRLIAVAKSILSDVSSDIHDRSRAAREGQGGGA